MVVRIISAIAVIFIIGINVVFLSWEDQDPRVALMTESGRQFISVEVARSADEKRDGLMFREFLDEDSGMFFVYQNSQRLSFWMKNTYIPLDMIFIGRDLKVKRIEDSAPPCKTQVNCPIYSSKEPVKYVLEVAGGVSKKIGLKEGDSVELLYDK